MSFSKLILASIMLICVSLSFTAYAIDLYVDIETKQIYVEPGAGREHLGSFQRIEDSSINTSGEGATYSEQKAKSEETKIPQERLATMDTTKVSLGKDGLKFETSDGDFKFKLGGRIHADASFSSGDNFRDADGQRIEANDGTELRRGRMEFSGTFFRDWNFKSQVDFADNQVGVKDMFINYTGLDFIDIIVGEQKQAFSRELQESSNDMIFIERSVMNVLNESTVDRALGLNVSRRGRNWTGQVGIYGDTIAANKRKTRADEGWAVSSRVTFAPIMEESRVIHLGVAGNFREPNDAGEIADRPLQLASESTHMSNLNLISAGITDIKNIKMLGLEASGVMGPFSIGGEYTNTWIDRKNGESSLNFNGWYGEAAWTLTGESRNYKNGKFYKVIPAKNFSFTNGGMGAWELAVRYAEVDLNDNTFKGGKLSNLTIALNWYLNETVRLMAGYDKALKITDSPLTKSDGSKLDNLDTFMIRAQLAF
ncbi:phosphate-selective porin OprO and OprP [Nitrosomonas cryotolerans]|uniref:Phosphate-selective porin OprO and OprP n=1 Tax=Nitrosomonas cryotolerans ATCC 49181 TaxID=1131553 RepID=A0A1N6H8E1_9PROT|nr:phosphate-selective porin OprO and OprP [Nitrosomonas cryotolerans]SIO15937.1 phosphate-selective porin OprO and OprP [Nitrosomonas cryotolerans ATCC 49181]